MIRAALILWLLAGAAQATNEGWPALYDVVDVGSGDVLNVREEPGSDGEIIGALPYDAESVEIVRAEGDPAWGLVNINEGVGWVSMRYLARQPEQLDYIYPEFTSCAGTEPFWNLTRDGAAITYEIFSEDMPPRTETLVSEKTAVGHRHRYSFRTENLVGVLARQYCDDGMSGYEYGLELNLILLEEDYLIQGCCSIQPPAR